MTASLVGVDLTDLDNFAQGFWSVATHAETLAVLRDPKTYSSVTRNSIAGGLLALAEHPDQYVEVG